MASSVSAQQQKPHQKHQEDSCPAETQQTQVKLPGAADTNLMTTAADNVVLVDVAWLKAHEQFIPARFQVVLNEIQAVNAYQWPLLVDAKTGVILDGHHRHHTALELKLKKVPAVLIDYLTDARVSVCRWRKELESWQSGGDASGATVTATDTVAVRSGSECYDAESLAAAMAGKSPPSTTSSAASGASPVSCSPKPGSLLVTKEEVIRRGLAGEVYPPKSTRHLLHEGMTLPKVYVPLTQLY